MDPKDQVRVVVVEDDIDASQTLQALLEVNGYTVEAAFTAEEAIRLVERFRPACVMLDLGLPDRETGLQLAKTLRARFGPTIVTVVVSGHSSRQDIEDALAAGADYVLPKPIDVGSISSILQPVRSSE